VRTSPARIRQVRQGDNPWYEVVLIEGRNRELRKMFSAVGHFVEKIRRVGYGPLVLDQEPGNLRELQPEELTALRLAAEGKLRTPKAKEVRRRNLADSQLPTVAPKPSRPRPAAPFVAKTFDKGPAATSQPGEFRPKRSFSADKPFRPAPSRDAAEPARSGGKNFGPARPAWKKDDRAPRPPARFGQEATGERRPPAGKPYGDRAATGRTYGARPASGSAARPASGPASRPAAGRTFGARPAGRPFAGKPASGKPAFSKPDWKKSGSERPPFKQPAAPRRQASPPVEEFDAIVPGRLRIDPIEPGHPDTHRPDTRSKGPARPGAGRPPFVRPSSDRPRTGKPSFEKAGPAKPRFEKPRFDRSATGRSGGPDRMGARDSGPSRPPRGESGMARPFTTSSGKPRPGGARPSSKPFKPGGHSSSKPRPGGFSKPKPGGFSKSGPKGSSFKSKPGGAKRTSPGGKKRN
jgi:23S rRNA pseudouridine2605 synthase